MKKAGILAAASFAAASSSVALYSRSDRYTAPLFENEGSSVLPSSKETGSGSRRDGGDDRFTPRFDGLKFIETLVTAHR